MIKLFKILGISLGTMISIVVGIIGFWYILNPNRIVYPIQGEMYFKGSFLAAADGDMIATAYSDGVINKVKGIEDMLTFISTDSSKATIQSKIPVSNSVVSWPSILAWNPEKQFAYVAETRGIYRGQSQKVSDVWTDMPTGKNISIIDYSDRKQPKTIQTKGIGENIQGVSINYDHSLLVAGSTKAGKEIVIANLNDGLIGEVHYFSNLEISKKKDNNSGIKTVEFHPSKNIMAANLNNTHLVFYQVLDKDGKISLTQIGPSIAVAKHWSVGNWHPSGNYFILTDVAWGEGPLGAIFNGNGKLVSIKFVTDGDHKVISEVAVGLSPEGFDVSPDGNYAIVSNMRRTYGPEFFWFVAGRKNASLSLVKIDSKTGYLKSNGKQYGFEGALPEDVIFDEESNSIAVAVYHKQDELFPTRGWIDFWELIDDELIKINQRTFISRGVHNLLLLK